MGRQRTQIGKCSHAGCTEDKLSKGMCAYHYQLSRKGECKGTGSRHVPLPHTVWDLPSGKQVARCRYCDKPFQLQPQPQP
jgi:hypothetical protein